MSYSFNKFFSTHQTLVFISDFHLTYNPQYIRLSILGALQEKGSQTYSATHGVRGRSNPILPIQTGPIGQYDCIWQQERVFSDDECNDEDEHFEQMYSVSDTDLSLCTCIVSFFIPTTL